MSDDIHHTECIEPKPNQANANKWRWCVRGCLRFGAAHDTSVVITRTGRKPAKQPVVIQILLEKQPVVFAIWPLKSLSLRLDEKSPPPKAKRWLTRHSIYRITCARFWEKSCCGFQERDKLIIFHAWYSWMLLTVSSLSLSERIALTEASAAERLVAWEIFWAMAVERIWISSARASCVLGVLMTK